MVASMALNLVCVVFFAYMLAECVAWRKIAPIPTADDIRSVSCNTSSASSNQFVALSLNDAFVSDNLIDWSAHSLKIPTTSYSHAQICYFNSLSGSFFFAIVDRDILRSE